MALGFCFPVYTGDAQTAIPRSFLCSKRHPFRKSTPIIDTPGVNEQPPKKTACKMDDPISKFFLKNKKINVILTGIFLPAGNGRKYRDRQPYGKN
jgi:hypothetical protein